MVLDTNEDTVADTRQPTPARHALPVVRQATGFPRDCLFADPENALYDALGLYRGLGVTFLSVATPFAIKKRMDEARTGDLQDILPRWQPWIPPKLEQVGGEGENGRRGGAGEGEGVWAAGEGVGGGQGRQGGAGAGEGVGLRVRGLRRGERHGTGKGGGWRQHRVAAGTRHATGQGTVRSRRPHEVWGRLKA